MIIKISVKKKDCDLNNNKKKNVNKNTNMSQRRIQQEQYYRYTNPVFMKQNFFCLDYRDRI